MQQTPPALSPEAQELLAQLHDIHEPAAVGWWPPAPGWWLLALLLLGCAAAIVMWLRHRRRLRLRERYRGEAIRLLQVLDTQSPAAAQEINEILKRVAVVTYGRACCGNLTGKRWLDFLHDASAVECPPPAQKILLEQLYREGATDSSGNETLRHYAIEWVKSHGQPLSAAGETQTLEAAGV